MNNAIINSCKRFYIYIIWVSIGIWGILILLWNTGEQFEQASEATINNEQSITTTQASEQVDTSSDLSITNNENVQNNSDTWDSQTIHTQINEDSWELNTPWETSNSWIIESGSHQDNMIQWSGKNESIQSGEMATSGEDQDGINSTGVVWNISWNNGFDNAWSATPNIAEGNNILSWEVNTDIDLSGKHSVSGLIEDMEFSGNSIDTWIQVPYIVHSPRDFIGLAQKWLLITSFDPDSQLAYAVLFATPVLYSSPEGNVKISIPNETIITTEFGVPFDTSQLNLSEVEDSDYYSSIRIEKYDPFTETYTVDDVIPTEQHDRMEFQFWIPNQHLIFSRPLEVNIVSDQPEGSLVDLSADHGNGRGKDGIAISSSASCSGWIASEPQTITKVKDGKVTFYICWASTFFLTYVGGANFANFADASIAPGYVDKTVTFISWTHFATWSIISDVDIRIRRRPIDTQNPASFWTTNCYPREKYFRLTHPDGTQVNLINSAQLSTPNPNCPETTTNFDQSWATTITNNYSSGTYRPVWNLNTLNNKSPFGTRTLRMGDTANGDWVILYNYTITIKVIDPPLCIYSPVGVLTGIVVKNTLQVIDQQFDYFQVDDQRWLNSWYYTTLQLSNLTQLWGSGIIANTSIQWKADPLVLLWWTTNALVQLGAAWASYTTANTTSTFIFRNTAPNALKTSRYGSKIWLRVNVPAYTNVWTYTWTITYTLYEN